MKDFELTEVKEQSYMVTCEDYTFYLKNPNRVTFSHGLEGTYSVPCHALEVLAQHLVDLGRITVKTESDKHALLRAEYEANGIPCAVEIHPGEDGSEFMLYIERDVDFYHLGSAVKIFKKFFPYENLVIKHSADDDPV